MLGSAFEKLEIIYDSSSDSREAGSQILNESLAFVQSSHSQNCTLRPGALSEIASQIEDQILRLFVCSPERFHHVILRNRFILAKLKTARNLGLVLVESERDHATIRMKKHLAQLGKSIGVTELLKFPYSSNDYTAVIIGAAERLYLKCNETLFYSIAAIREVETKAMHDLGSALKSNSSVTEIGKLVLEKCMSVSLADAGFLLLCEQMFEDPVTDGVRAKILGIAGDILVEQDRINQSQNVRLRQKTLHKTADTAVAVVSRLGRCIAWNEDQGFMCPGFSAEIDEGLNILSSLSGFGFVFDTAKYRIANYCLVPIKTPSGETVGMIILVNRKFEAEAKLSSLEAFPSVTRPFVSSDLIMLEALTHQAGVSLDHARLIKNLKTVFESFVKASVLAIESRDPSTKGHSVRVATLAVALAQAVTDEKTGPLAGISFSETQLYELKYASLLHDFGKIGVREDVLQKERKLFPAELAGIKERFLHLERQLYLKCFDNFLTGLMIRAQVPTAEDIMRIKKEISRISRELAHFWNTIVEANEPQVVKSGSFQTIAEIAAITVMVNGQQTHLMNEREVSRLSLKKGSLSDEERREIEKHVTNSHRFLVQIPWTSELAGLTEIVYAHHERLDGTGYPRGLKQDEIPLQARIMAVCDIYDALVAMDRPYKKAIPHERAMNILEAEMLDGKLEPAFFELFRRKEIFKLILDDELRVAS